MPEQNGGPQAGFLPGVRVIELADELGEYCGKLLGDLGADVVKVEPPGGEPTRRYGPFYQDVPNPERSLYFWHYNLSKRGVTLDLDTPEGQAQFRELAKDADVLLDTRPRDYLESRGLGYEALKQVNPDIIVARISPFGDTGPWADYKGSDLVHLAAGGVMMNCGYDPDPSRFYETPPIAPQMWQAYHIAGEMTAMGIMGALFYRNISGKGQQLSTSVHEAVAKQTETDLPNWIYARTPHFRQTCRHSTFIPNPPSIALTKDGRWIMPSLIQAGGGGTFERAVELLDRYGLADDLKEEKYKDPAAREEPTVSRHITDVINRFVNQFLYSRDIWRDAQESALVWAPERKPEENLHDAHWAELRETFIDIEHPELDKTFRYIGAKWMAPGIPWRRGPRAPLIGEHNKEILGQPRPSIAKVSAPSRPAEVVLSKHGKPFPLAGVRVVDLSWLLASGGAGRFLGALGAEVIRVEHMSRIDFIRWGTGTAPPGGREERDRATEPLLTPRPESPNRSGFFMDINASKLGMSINLQTPRGKELLAKLIGMADIVAEGFSPGTMDRMGFGYSRLKEIKPDIIYVQQSGMGQVGSYGRMRSYGPIAAAFSGLSEMSGLPEPYPPAGIGYSYLDWFGAYNMSTAMFAALYRKQVTGEGCWIDSSQVESGTYLNGTAILDYTVNGRPWERLGNRSPYKPAAPHGAYRARGDDRWIAIACFTEAEWQGFLKVAGNPQWARDAKFASLESRIANQDELDTLVTGITETRDPFELMHALQQAGVPAGVCQTAEDRCDHDPQLTHLQWLTELPQTEIGTWPVKEFPVKLSETPAYMGGIRGRHGPNYGEDNAYIYGTLLGLSEREIEELAEQGVL